MLDVQAFTHRAPSIKHQPRSKRYYFDVGIGSVCLSGADTGGAYCLLEVALAPGMSVPRHTHTREDEAYFVLAGELEVVVGDEAFVLRAGDTSSLRATFPTSCAIPAPSRTTISSCSRRPGSRSF
jgi:quercetin dioxygenase-like cupin family protein